MHFSNAVKNLLFVLIYPLFVILMCEYVIYYAKLFPCHWPLLFTDGTESTGLRVLLLADPHLVGYFRGHPIDRIRRDWQMKRAFQTALALHKPKVVFIMGDILDEGLWSRSEQFEPQLARFSDIFAHDPNQTIIKCLIGNHDVGFHYVWNPYLNWRFYKNFQKDESASPVRLWSHSGIHFVTANSMAFEGDQCDLCREAEHNLEAISNHLKCLQQHRQQACIPKQALKNPALLPKFIDPVDSDLSSTTFSKPILLQHFPLYRDSELGCSAEPLDAMPKHLRHVAYRPKMDCISKASTQKILRLLNPRLVLAAHTHYSCELDHQIDGQPESSIPERTIASFSWRNLRHPNFVLLTVSPTDYAMNKCYLPTEPEIVMLYLFFILLPVLVRCRRSFMRMWLNLVRIITRTLRPLS